MKERDANGKLLYQNHYQLKKVRLEKLQQTKGKCEICGEHANTIHHKDCSVDNHTIENLIVLCQSCHVIIHKPESSAYFPVPHSLSKFTRIYGMTLEKIADKIGRSYSFCYNKHKKGLLADLLKNA